MVGEAATTTRSRRILPCLPTAFSVNAHGGRQVEKDGHFVRRRWPASSRCLAGKTTGQLTATASRLFFAAIILGAALAAPVLPASAQIFGTSPPATPEPTTIVGRMGEAMSEAAARHLIAFRPFAPPRQILAAALLPPFRGADERANRGIGLEYADAAGHRYALAQWPANGGSIERFPPLAEPEPSCNAARMFARGTTPNGIVWSTPHGIVMTLQADGANDAQTLRSEWRKLLLRGVCR